MLLRSASTPVLNSWIRNLASGSGSGSAPESDALPPISRTRLFCLSMSTRTCFDPDLMKTRKGLRPPLLLSSSGLGGSSSDLRRRNGSDSTEAYYESMIIANPGNALLLANYAKFLKEVKGDLAKAEECCGRAILANPSDGYTRSMYADLVWQTQRDASRAESYFDQAVKTDPNDCYVLASLSQFLWDAEEDGEGEAQERNQLDDGGNGVPLKVLSTNPPAVGAAC